jgi:hypothetical protein
MASAFLCATLGIVPTVRHTDYIGAWLEVLREDNRAVVRAASAASKAADFILAFRPDALPSVAVPVEPDARPAGFPEPLSARRLTSATNGRVRELRRSS